MQCLPVAVRAQSVDACRDRIVEEMSADHDEYRSYVFGSRVSRGSSEFTILTGGTADEERLGILETPKRLTSELVPPLVESYRALRCHLLTTCEVMGLSLQSKDHDVTVRVLGCDAETVPLFPQCYLAGGGSSSSSSAGQGGTISQAYDLSDYCSGLAQDTIEFERHVLHLAVAYDSGYRAMTQIAGMIDWVQTEVPTSVLRPIRDMINLLGKLHQIPCFIGECDYPPDTEGL